MPKQLPPKITGSDQYKRFVSSLHNAATKKKYLDVLLAYSEHLGANKAADLFGTPLKIEKNIEGWIAAMKSSGVRGTTIKGRCHALKKFYEQNRVSLAWKIISNNIPKSKPLRIVGWRREQIQEMLKWANDKEKAMIPLLASTGMRKGAIPLLNVGDFIPRNEWGIFEIIGYRNEDEEFHTYCSPEARSRLEDYWALRKRCGEALTPDSPAFRHEWNLEDSGEANKPVRITEHLIDSAMRDIVFKAGLRQKVKAGTKSQAGKVRHPQKLVHGFRAFYETTMLDNGFSEQWLQKLKGEKILGLRENYYKTEDRNILVGFISSDGKFRQPGYVDIMRELVISDEERAKIKIVELEKKVIGEERMQKQIDEQNARMNQMALDLYNATNGNHPTFDLGGGKK